MKSFALLVLLAGPATAGNMTFGANSASVDFSINGTPISPSTVQSGTVTISLNSANNTNAFPYSPLMVFGNANTYLQFVLQNLSNGTNASGDFIITNDLGGDTSFYLDIGVNSSKFSQSGQSAQASSSTFISSSDSDLLLWAGSNGGLNLAASEKLIFGSSNPVSANIAGWVMENQAWVLKSSVTVLASAGINVATATLSNIMGNGAIAISTAANKGVMTTANINVNTSGQTVFTPNLSSYTTSGALSGSPAFATIGTCVVGSSLTLVLPTGNSLVMVGFNGTISVNSLSAIINIGVIVDGGFVNGETATKGLTAPLEPVSTDGTNMSFAVPVAGLAAGSHNFCLATFVSAGTETIDSTNSVAKFWAYTLP